MQLWMMNKLKALTSLFSHSLKATLLFWFLTLSIVPFIYGYAHTASSIDEMQGYEDLLRNADTALYSAKEKGRNCVILYEEKLL